MGTITALSAQKRSPDRVNVYIDGEFAFGLTYAAAVHLKVGQTLSPAQIEALQQEDTVEKARESALRFITYRPRSQVEVQRHLEKKGYAAPAIAQVIERLTAVDLLNDEQFARYWIEQRETFKPRGRLALRQELQQKGVAADVIDQALSATDEASAAQHVAEKKAHQLAGQPEAQFKGKLGQYLQRRGFPYDIIRATTNELWATIGAPAATDSEA